MSSYTAHQYKLQDDIMRQVRWAATTNTCPVCRIRPRAVWPDGVQRTTCGATACYMAWLPIQHKRLNQ